MSDPVGIDSVAPKWNTVERDMWMDLFTNYCDSLMGATLEESSGLKRYPEQQLKTDITLAAELADHALKEVGFRLDMHVHQAKRRTGSAKQPARRMR